ncbi:hemerythrin domain-containing protein [Sphingomonas sp. RS2018]
MTYLRLIAEHNAIDAAADVVVALSKSTTPRPAEAAAALEVLAQLLRDHLSGEEDAIFHTLLAAKGGRHAETAERMGIEFDRLKDDWGSYLYRWDGGSVVARWDEFATETQAMLGRIRERVMFETMMLYSLGVHLEVIAVE